MKISKLFVLTALSLSASSAMAAVVEGVRQKPEVPQTFTQYVEGDTLYMYNVGSKMFFRGANDYDTRASVGEKGFKVTFTRTDVGVELRDSVEKHKKWMATFVIKDAGNNDIWVDNDGEENRYWTVTEVEGAYRISNDTKAEITGMYLGWNGHADNTRLYFFSPEELGDTASIDWKFMTQEVYQAYETSIAVFLKAQDLKAQLDAAKEKNLNVADQEAVYLNESATMEDIEAAITQVKAIIAKAAEDAASVAKPVDLTSNIVNPNFDGHDATGWKGTAPAWGAGGQEPSDVAEHYNKNYDTYQELTDMPKGVYMLSANGFYRGSGDGWSEYKDGTNKNGLLYAVADEKEMTQPLTTRWSCLNTQPMAGATDFGPEASEAQVTVDDVTYYAPNNPAAARLYFEKGWYMNNLFFSVDGGSVKLGVKKTVAVGSDWTVFDNFKLTYFGNKAEAYQYWLTEVVKNGNQYDKNTQCTESYLEDYENAAKNATATNRDEVLSVLASIKTVEDSLIANINLWKELAALYTEAEAVQADKNISADWKEDLQDEMNDVSKAQKGLNLDNDELRELIAEFDDIISETKKHLAPGTDCTYYLKNADFQKGAEGWNGNPAIGGNPNKCAEAYDKKFDIYQELKNAPVGVYEIEVQSFFRLDRDQTAYDRWLAGTQTAPGVVYMNQAETPLKCVFSEPVANGILGYEADGQTPIMYTEGGVNKFDGNWFPNDMTTAAEAFAAGMYKTSAFGLVAKDGDPMRLGVKGDCSGPNWAIFDNFKLTYHEYKADVVLAAMNSALADLNGVVDGKNYGKDVKENVASVAKAAADVNKEEGKAMFEVLISILEVTEKAKTSIALFDQLTAANTRLGTAVQNPINMDEQGNAGDLYDQISGQITSGALTDAEAKEAIDKIEEMITLLNTDPAYKHATDDNPVDMTSLIKSPGFEKIENDVKSNSIEGWQNTTGYNFGNDDTQKGAYALEFYEKKFDMYQDIKGLPNGTYEVSVQLFNRIGGFDNDFAEYTKNPKAAQAYLYAVGDGKTSSAPAVCATAGALTSDPQISGQSSQTFEGTTYYMPNDMVSCAAFFDMGSYKTSLIVKVTDKTLRIGVKKDEQISGDWVLLDNFTLTYYGENSQKEASDDASGISTISMRGAQTEFFTLDGRKTNAAQKGIFIQKTVLDNGKVVVRKVQK
ncbi:hypothetical protein L6472_12765 [Prevotella sp. E13-17]|uniref:hypothetical protein n=1 Tax=Prevotella sp. E13-17 TaxID=2913616 RepID=UPI001EDC2DE3|nr:hypothetical protein [Prevotella sp. E13-17]UKK50864.1 hypothetical protein L6472_12765 [Prevotella sp. E13-17]